MKKASTTLSSKPTKPTNTEQSVTQLILLLHSQQLSAWQAVPGQPPKALKINGEYHLTVRDTPALADAYADLAKRLHDDGIHTTHTFWIVDANGWPWCSEKATPTTWLLPWEWLAQRFGLGTASPWENADILKSQILPWLVTGNDAIQRQKMQQAREREHASETERLAAKRVDLELENEKLRALNATLQQVDAENLLRFLPALYPRVFTVLGATDLALLCGRVEPFPIENPYPEPSEETLRILQKDFQNLPAHLQQEVVGFVKRLPQRQKLIPRPEMRDIVIDLERV